MCCVTLSASSGSAPALVVPTRSSSRVSGVPTALRSVLRSAVGLSDATICCSRFSSSSACVGAGAGCAPAAAAVAGGTAAGEGASAACEPEAAAAAAAVAGVGVTEGGVGRLSEAIMLRCGFCGRWDCVNLGSGETKVGPRSRSLSDAASARGTSLFVLFAHFKLHEAPLSGYRKGAAMRRTHSLTGRFVFV